MKINILLGIIIYSWRN